MPLLARRFEITYLRQFSSRTRVSLPVPLRKTGEFPAEIVQLRFIQPIRVQGGHLEMLSYSPFVRLL
jgi:hypothetical protein